MRLASIGRSVFVCVALFSTIEAAEAQGRPGANSALATASVNVRQGPGTRFPAVDVLSRGEQVDIVRCERNFCLVVHDGPQGWVAQRYLKRLVVHPR